MALVNCSVVHQQTHKMIFPWKILNSHVESVTVGGYYSQRIQPMPDEEKQNLVLSRALLGNSKDTLDTIEIDVDLNSAISMFGHFLKFEVSDSTEPLHDLESRRSAFDVMMAAQRQLCLPRLPPRIEKERLTKKGDTPQ